MQPGGRVVITRRTMINLGVFLAMAAALIFFGVVSLLSNPFQSRTQVAAVFPDASGLHENFSVTYNGVDVGSVTGVKLTDGGGVRVTMSFDPGVTVPGDVLARVDLANALGEQQVDLVPTRGGQGPPLHSGATIPVDPQGVPASVGKLVAVTTRLLDAVPAGDLNTVLHELAVALRGRGQDLRTITDASRAFADEFLRYQVQFRALLANAPPVLDAVSASGPELRQALANTAVLTQVLADRRSDLSNALGQGAVAGQDLQALVSSQLPNLACLTHDFRDLNVNLSQQPNLGNLNTSLATNEWFFGAVDSVSPVGKATGLYPGDAAHSQYWLRTRLLLPPAQPPANPYPVVKDLPPTKPAAACNTEYGAGAPAAAQANPSPVGPGGRVIAPTAAEGQVRGGASAGSTGKPSSYRRPAAGPRSPSGSLWALLVGALTVGGAWWVAGRRVPEDPAGRYGRPLWRRR